MYNIINNGGDRFISVVNTQAFQSFPNINHLVVGFHFMVITQPGAALVIYAIK